MKKNISSTDRILRLLFAAVVTILYFTNAITGTLGIVLMISGAILAITGFINFCPIYSVFGISSNKAKAK